uniref:MADF domain-containing protein n=1 Tax=Photinus pyralis TaxID=7054 RepID=A0A1Y1MH02_PHOPY
MSWSNREVRVLIEEVQKYPCLYLVKSANYKNKHARNEALASIVKALLPLRPGVCENDIKAKFNGIKSNFFSEHRKVLASQKSGAGSDDVYKPTLWYYDLLVFLLEHYETRSAYDSLGEASQTQTQNETITESLEEEVMEEDTVYMLDTETGMLIPESNISEIDREQPPILNTPKTNCNSNRKRKKTSNEDNSQFFMESTKALQNLTAATQQTYKWRPTYGKLPALMVECWHNKSCTGPVQVNYHILMKF